MTPPVTLLIVIPSHQRSDRAAEVYQNVRQNTVYDHEVVFCVESEDFEDYKEALKDCDAYVMQNYRSRNYAGAVNSTVTTFTNNMYIFLGADDVDFHPNWDTAAMDVMLSAKHVRVVGTNDLLNSYVLKGWHATHYLVDRRYLEEPGGVVDGAQGHALFEGYSHNFTDTEFVGTAKARAVFAPCLDSVVEHLHWSAGKMERDATTEKTCVGLDKDAELYQARTPLWWGLSR